MCNLLISVILITKFKINGGDHENTTIKYILFILVTYEYSFNSLGVTVFNVYLKTLLIIHLIL